MGYVEIATRFFAMTPLRIVFTALLPFASGYLMSYLLRAVNAVVAPDLVRDAGLSPAELGLLTAAYLGAFALFQLPLGVLLDRYGPRRVQSVLLLVAAMGVLGFAAAPGFGAMFAARAVIGFGFSAGLMASYKSSATWVPLERRSLANTAIMAVGALGVVAATEPTEMLVAAIGWRLAFVVFAGLICLVALFVLASAPRKDTVGTPTSFKRQFAELLMILRHPLYWRIAPLLGLTSGVQLGIQTLWAGPWFRDVMGLGREDVARHLLILAITFMAGILAVGVIADRLGKRLDTMRILVGFNVIYFIAQAIIVARIEALLLPAWMVVAAIGQVAVLAFPWFAARIGPELSGRSNAAINFAIFVSAFASQYAVGFVIGLFPATGGNYDPAGYSWALGIFLVLQLAAFVWYLMGPASQGRKV